MELKKKKIKAGGLKFILEDHGEKIGRAYLYLLKNELHDNPFAFVEDIFIGNEYRGQGLGSKLVEEIIQEAKKCGCYKIIMTSRHSNERAHKLYERLGFVDHGKEFRIDLKEKI